MRPSSRLDPICPASCPIVGGLTRAILGLGPGLGPRIQQPAATTIRLPSADFPQQQQSSPPDQDKVRCLEAALIILIDGMQIREKSCYNSPAGDVLLIILLLSSF